MISRSDYSHLHATVTLLPWSIIFSSVLIFRNAYRQWELEAGCSKRHSRHAAGTTNVRATFLLKVAQNIDFSAYFIRFNLSKFALNTEQFKVVQSVYLMPKTNQIASLFASIIIYWKFLGGENCNNWERAISQFFLLRLFRVHQRTRKLWKSGTMPHYHFFQNFRVRCLIPCLLI